MPLSLTTQKCLGEKPPVPPKPSHLSRTVLLPKPPLFSAENLENVMGNLKDVRNSNGDHVEDSDYGYSEAAVTMDTTYYSPSIPYCAGSDRRNTNLNYSLSEITSSQAASIDHKEISELVGESSNIVKDVRQRPLPLLPGERQQSSVTEQPWYKLVNRRESEQLVRNGVDGYFLVRPSSKGESCLTLTLWFNGRSYNIPIRKRVDGFYALGTPKDLEQSFSTVEDMIRNYQKEELVLYSQGVETGKTTLKIYPA